MALISEEKRSESYDWTLKLCNLNPLPQLQLPLSWNTNTGPRFPVVTWCCFVELVGRSVTELNWKIIQHSADKRWWEKHNPHDVWVCISPWGRNVCIPTAKPATVQIVTTKDFEITFPIKKLCLLRGRWFEIKTERKWLTHSMQFSKRAAEKEKIKQYTLGVGHLVP